MSIDSMGSIPLNASEPANAAQPDNTTESSTMDISPPDEKQDGPVSEEASRLSLANGNASVPNENGASTGGQAPAAPAMDIPSANEANGSRARDVPLADESMEDELRPAKKQKQRDSSMSMDVSESPYASESGVTSTPNNDANELVQVEPVSTDAATASDDTGTVPVKAGSAPTTSTDDDVGDYRSIVHPNVAEIIKLEDIPAVKPLENLTIRDMAGEFDVSISRHVS